MPRRLLPIDPRPSRADPEARKIRKEMEKEHSYEWVPPVLLGLLGIGLAYDVTKDVAKHEEKHKKEEEEALDRRRRRRQGNEQYGSHRRRRAGSEDRWEDNRGRDRDRIGDGRRDGRRANGFDVPYDDYDKNAGTDNRDGGLDRADALERGEGGWRRGGKGVPYDDYGRGGRPRRGRYDDEEDNYDDQDDDDGDSYNHRGRRQVDDRRGRRPLPRRRSSDW